MKEDDPDNGFVSYDPGNDDYNAGRQDGAREREIYQLARQGIAGFSHHMAHKDGSANTPEAQRKRLNKEFNIASLSVTQLQIPEIAYSYDFDIVIDGESVNISQGTAADITREMIVVYSANGAESDAKKLMEWLPVLASEERISNEEMNIFINSDPALRDAIKLHGQGIAPEEAARIAIGHKSNAWESISTISYKNVDSREDIKALGGEKNMRVDLKSIASCISLSSELELLETENNNESAFSLQSEFTDSLARDEITPAVTGEILIPKVLIDFNAASEQTPETFTPKAALAI